jgi:hypothetical protein
LNLPVKLLFAGFINVFEKTFAEQVILLFVFQFASFVQGLLHLQVETRFDYF